MSSVPAGVERLAERIATAYQEKNFPVLKEIIQRDVHRTRRDFMNRCDLALRRMNQTIGVETTVGKYVEPELPALKTKRYEPEPTHQINLRLRTDLAVSPGDESYEDLYFACAPGEDDEYVTCYLTPREPTKVKKPRAPKQIDMAALAEELQKSVTNALARQATTLGARSLAFFLLEYSVGLSPDNLSVYAYEDPLESYPTKAVHLGGQFAPAEGIAMAYGQLIDGALNMKTDQGEVISLEQEHFEAQYPDWKGERRFRQELRRCLQASCAAVLNVLVQMGKFTWQGEPTALVVSGEESHPEMRHADDSLTCELGGVEVIDGVTFPQVIVRRK